MEEIENQGWIAPADCVEVRVTLDDAARLAYAVAEPDDRYRLCSTSDTKTRVVERLVEKHAGEPTLVIGQYIDQLDDLAERLHAPVVKGQTTVRERQRLYEAFRSGELPVLVVSKVANFSIDLPEASVAIQVSGTFGSRQEEAQRLGRILRPRPTAAPRASTRSSHATPSIRNSLSIGSGSWLSRGIRIGSSTPRTFSPVPIPPSQITRRLLTSTTEERLCLPAIRS